MCFYPGRYCAYNIGDTSAANDLVGIRLAMGHIDSELDELIQKTRERQAGSLHEVTWRQRVIPIKIDKVCQLLCAGYCNVRQVKAARILSPCIVTNRDDNF